MAHSDDVKKNANLVRQARQAEVKRDINYAGKQEQQIHIKNDWRKSLKSVSPILKHSPTSLTHTDCNNVVGYR